MYFFLPVLGPKTKRENNVALGPVILCNYYDNLSQLHGFDYYGCILVAYKIQLFVPIVRRHKSVISRWAFCSRFLLLLLLVFGFGKESEEEKIVVVDVVVAFFFLKWHIWWSHVHSNVNWVDCCFRIVPSLPLAWCNVMPSIKDTEELSRKPNCRYCI